MHDDIGTSLYKSPKKNFELIYNSMYHGEPVGHEDLAKTRQKTGEKNKEMGKMSHNNAVESNHNKEFKKGDLNHVQLDEGEDINLSSVEEAKKDGQKILAQQGAKSSENQELLKKIDIKKMF